MRVGLCFALVVLAGCTGGSSGMGGGSAGGGSGGGVGGGSGGGTAADAGSFAIRLLPNGAGIFGFSGPDAAFITLTRDSDPDAGLPASASFVPVLGLGPDGTTFNPAATAGVPLEVTASPDGGYYLPFWALQSADGGLEAVASLSRLLVTDPEQPATGSALARVPHFTTLGTAGAGAQVELRLVPQKASFEVGEKFGYQVLVRPVNGFGVSFTVETRFTGTLAGASYPAGSTGVVTNVWASNVLAARCTGEGSGTIQFLVTATAWKNGLFSLEQLAPQSASLEQRVLCHKTVLPSKEDVGVVPGTTPRDTNPPFDATITEAFRLHDALRGYVDLPPNAVTGKFAATCGRGQGPCEIGVEYDAVLELTNTLPEAIRRHGNGVMNIRVPAAVTTEYRIQPPPLQPNVTQVFLFKFKCVQEGLSSVSFSMGGTRAGGAIFANNIYFDFGTIRCGGTGDAIMLSDNTRLTRTGNTWNAMATGVTANVISATEAMLPKFGSLDELTVGYDNVTAFNSRAGFPRLRLQSGLQNGLFTHNGTRYAQTGLVGTPAYGATDTLTVTGIQADGGTGTLPDGGSAVVVLPAPPALPAPNALFGAREGLRTMIRLPDGTFDVLYVSLGTASPRGGEGGLFRTVPASAMALDAGMRETPLLDDASLRALDDWGLDAGTLYVAAYRQATVDGFFTRTDGGSRPVPVQAGRMVQISVPDLAP